MHSGIHTGEVLLAADGDVFGQTVNLAARLQDVAGPGEIVLSDDTRRNAELPDEATRSMGARRLKNIPEPFDCHLIIASAGDAVLGKSALSA
jgi:class 3 adenylate cyclase